MRISDWSSDVCSSDLHDSVSGEVAQPEDVGQHDALIAGDRHTADLLAFDVLDLVDDLLEGLAKLRLAVARLQEIAQTLPKPRVAVRSEEHTSELQSLMRISYAVFCLKKKRKRTRERLNRRELQENITK